MESEREQAHKKKKRKISDEHRHMALNTGLHSTVLSAMMEDSSDEESSSGSDSDRDKKKKSKKKSSSKSKKKKKDREKEKKHKKKKHKSYREHNSERSASPSSERSVRK